MPATGRSHGWVVGALAAALGIALSAWIISILWPNHGSLRGPSTDSRAGAFGGAAPKLEALLTIARRPADVPVAPMADFYEHGIEHTPPRDPSGAMQRRERFYSAPADPFEILTVHLSSSDADRAFGREVARWEGDWKRGSGSADVPLGLDELAAASSVKAEALLEAGRAMQFLSGEQAAAAFFRVGLARAQEQYKSTQPGDPAARALLRLLDQTRVLWQLRDYKSLEQRFALAERLNAPLSVEARRAGCLHATALFYQGRNDDACQTIFRVWDEDNQAGDLGALEKSDFGEMYWVTSLYLYCAGRYKEAVPYYEKFIRTDDNRRQQGVQMLIMCLERSGGGEAAERRIKELEEQFGIRVRRARTTTAPAGD